MEYDDLGQPYKKKLHSTNSGSTFLQTVTYGYTERGWLKTASAPLFSFELRYDNPASGGVAQYNGNISGFEYTAPTSGSKSFMYTYDKVNRLLESSYSTASQLNESILYDKNGNITWLRRGPSTNSPIYYSYANSSNSNQLSSVYGARARSYTYDGNGNVLTDSVNITYNHLNLPATVSGSNGGTYTYDAGGNKLRSVQGALTTDYISGVHYKNNVLSFMSTDEGRVVRNNTTGAYTYEYNLKDHLGNVRVSFDDNAGTARLIQEDEYYAFGLAKPKIVFGDKNNYLYNGKELQTALASVYDYGARFYDPVIGRWNVVDPLAEKGRRWSPYVYGFNNPIRFTDPDGMWPDDGYGSGDDDLTGVQMGMAIGGAIRGGIHGVRNLLAAAGDALGINKAAAGMKWQSVDTEGGIMGFGMAQVPSEGGLKDALGHLGDGANALAFNGSLAKGTTGTLFAKTGQEATIASEGLGALKTAVHANSKASTLENTLYRLETNTGQYLKTGITSKAIIEKRYTNKFLEGKRMIPLRKGTRADLLKRERNIVETDPGPLNFEPWAGSKRFAF